ncbi:unnamed protein product, partial [Effrenium voratum]
FDASELKRDWFMTEEVAFGEGIAPFFDARFRVASSLAETDVADLAGNLMATHRLNIIPRDDANMDVVDGLAALNTALQTASHEIRRLTPVILG